LANKIPSFAFQWLHAKIWQLRTSSILTTQQTFVEHTRTQHPDAVTDPLANLYSGLHNPALIFKDSLERVYETVRGSIANRSNSAPDANGPKNVVSLPEVASCSGSRPVDSDSQPAASVSQPADSSTAAAQLSSVDPNQLDDYLNAFLTVSDLKNTPDLVEETGSSSSSSDSEPNVAQSFNPDNFLSLGTSTTSDDPAVVDFDPLAFDFDTFLQSDSATNFDIKASAVPTTNPDPPASTFDLTTDQHPLQPDLEELLRLPEIPADFFQELIDTGGPGQNTTPQTTNQQESQEAPAANIINYIAPVVGLNCDNLESRGTKRSLDEFLGQND